MSDDETFIKHLNTETSLIVHNTIFKENVRENFVEIRKLSGTGFWMDLLRNFTSKVNINYYRPIHMRFSTFT